MIDATNTQSVAPSLPAQIEFTSRYRAILLTLTARTAVLLGSGQDNDVTDALIRRDAQGDPILPGTALAGALRAILTRLAPRMGSKICVALQAPKKQVGEPQPCSCAVCQLMGDVNPSDAEKEKAAASRLLVFDARLKDAATMVRDGVGIDRVTGAAARAGAVKFDLEVLPAGTIFVTRLELRNADNDDEQLLAAGLAEWCAGRMWLGGRVARGLGAFKAQVKMVERTFMNGAQIFDWLDTDEPWKNATDVTTRLTKTRVQEARGRIAPLETTNQDNAILKGWALAEFTLAATGPLLTSDAVASLVSSFDHAPLLANVEDWTQPVLTGAGLRGVLRSHAERIARTLVSIRAARQKDISAREFFLARCPACDPLVSRNPNRTEEGVAMESCDSLLRYERNKGGDDGISQQELCLACRLFGSTRWGSRLIVEDAPFLGKPDYKMMDFLAIDRFTGGGSEGLKFNALALWQPRFHARLYLENPEPWELGWLALVLRDLKEGWLSLGFGAAKGFGKVKIQEASLNFGCLTPQDFPNGKHAFSAFPAEPEYDGVFQIARAQNNAAWRELAQSWVREFNDKLEEEPRNKDLNLPADSYFGVADLDKLYPLEVN